MSQVYTQEEKEKYVEDFKQSRLPLSEYAREQGMPESTLRGWVKMDREEPFGIIDFSGTGAKTASVKTTVFVNEDIRIELKENFNKERVSKIMEVLLS